MRLISAQEAANKWGITKRRVLTLCATNRIKDAELVGNIWVLPADAEKPEDARIKQPLESDDRATIKSARNSLKSVCQSSIRILLSKGYTFYEARKVLLAILSKEDFKGKIAVFAGDISRHDLGDGGARPPLMRIFLVKNFTRRRFHQHPGRRGDKLLFLCGGKRHRARKQRKRQNK